MLRQSALFATVAVLASSAAAGPMRRQSTVLSGGSAIPVFAMGSSSFDPSSSTLSSFGSSGSFDNWGGISSLSGFDNFYGSDNFCGQQNSIHMSGESVVCQSANINYVQQQYAVLAEYAKKVLLSNVCEVESQAIVWGQFMGMMQSFQNDFMHLSESRPPTFDSNVAGQINSLCSESGDINIGDLGISGSSIGSSCVSVSGLNWNPISSPQSCGQAWSDCQSVISSSLSAPICGSSTSVSSSCTEIHEPPVVVSGGSSIISDCGSSDCGSSSISSDCGSESDCGSSSISSDCGSSDCGSSIISSMPSMDCGSSDCSSITAGNDSSVDNSTLSDGGDDGADATDSAGDAIPLPTDLPSADNSTSTDSSDASATGSDGAVAALPTDSSDDSSASATDSAGDAAPTDSSDDSASSTDSTDDSASSTDSAADASSTGSGVVAL